MINTISFRIFKNLFRTKYTLVFFLLAVCFTVFIFIQEPVTFVERIYGLPMKWHYYIIAVANAFNYMFTFLALWYTIPFTNKLTGYWYVPIFIITLAVYT